MCKHHTRVPMESLSEMTLHLYFKQTLPTAEQTGLTEQATREANQAVAAALQECSTTSLDYQF